MRTCSALCSAPHCCIAVRCPLHAPDMMGCASWRWSQLSQAPSCLTWNSAKDEATAPGVRGTPVAAASPKVRQENSREVTAHKNTHPASRYLRTASARSSRPRAVSICSMAWCVHGMWEAGQRQWVVYIIQIRWCWLAFGSQGLQGRDSRVYWQWLAHRVCVKSAHRTRACCCRIGSHPSMRSTRAPASSSAVTVSRTSLAAIMTWR
jgi:hypothetical protein